MGALPAGRHFLRGDLGYETARCGTVWHQRVWPPIQNRDRISGIAVRDAPGVASRAVRPIASRVLGTPAATARNLLVHCAREMNHLAAFLPDVRATFGDD